MILKYLFIMLSFNNNNNIIFSNIKKFINII